MWPELDKLLRDEDDVTAVSTPYTAAVLEYRVVFYDPEDAKVEDRSWSSANGHAVHDAQHPCRCVEYVDLISCTVSFTILIQHYPNYILLCH